VIVVDSSAWIEFFRATGSSVHHAVRRLLQSEAPVAATEVVVMEVLAGVRSEREWRATRTQLLGLPVLPLHGIADYERAARLYRACRQRGVTPRRLTDMLIALCALDADAAVLHADRDFDHIAAAVGLVVHPHDPPDLPAQRGTEARS
jgi:predicted nucleic acid-binding protein